MQQEKIVEVKVCKHCWVSFDITDKDLEFYNKVSPIFNWVKYNIPSPTLCPDCRQQRIFSFRNERKLYKRKCGATGKDIISVYSPDKPYTVYEQGYRWSDNWDEMKFWQEIDFKENFLLQYEKLEFKMPKRALVKWTWSENSDYANWVWASKNCYLMFDSTDIENCYYWNRYSFCTNCIDCTGISNCENCYNLVDCVNCFWVQYSQDCLDCSNSSYLFNCKWCSLCFWCVNLSNKKYHIFNKEYSKDDYQKEIDRLIKKWYSNIDFFKFSNSFPRINLTIINSENVLWDKIYNSNNINNSYDIAGSSDISYCSVIFKNCSDIYDSYVCLNNSNHIYNSVIINKRCSNILFCNDCWHECSNLIYCWVCKTCKDCFLCSWLRDKQYCILNKQYTKEEYEILVPKIIEHMKKTWDWWEFFPSSISTFGYNETVAMEYFPFTKKETINLGFNRSNYEFPFPKVSKIIPANMLPEDISKIPDDILNRAIECEVTKKPFKIISQELEFYKKHNLPIPKRHPDQRHLDRMTLRNPRKLFNRKCDKCRINIKTTYDPLRPEIVYCEECYNKEIY